MRQLAGATGDYVYRATVSAIRAATDYTARVIPYGSGLVVHLEPLIFCGSGDIPRDIPRGLSPAQVGFRVYGIAPSMPAIRYSMIILALLPATLREASCTIPRIAGQINRQPHHRISEIN